jgi:hypothetical protein
LLVAELLLDGSSKRAGPIAPDQLSLYSLIGAGKVLRFRRIYVAVSEALSEVTSVQCVNQVATISVLQCVHSSSNDAKDARFTFVTERNLRISTQREGSISGR